jgi:hypothetical protein
LIDEYSDPSRGLYDSDQFHSRSPSESSTSRLATSAVNNKASPREAYNDYDYYNQQDPYAPRQSGKKKKKKHQNQQNDYRQTDIPEKRANSYLPYSNHRRDPYDPIEPIYLEEEHLPSFNSPGSRGPIGSILQDNIVMDMMDQEAPAPHKGQITPITNALPPTKKHKKFKCLGIGGKKLLFIVFTFIAIVAVIWYFVWPRTPTLLFSNADFPTGQDYVYSTDTQTYYAQWNVNFTADNTVNWIPTSISYYEAKAIDKNTGVKIGYGKTGSFKIPAKTTTQIVTIPIVMNYTQASTSDTTWDDLSASCIVTKSDPGAVQALNIIFELTCHVAGIVWTQTSTAGPTTGLFQCPQS